MYEDAGALKARICQKVHKTLGFADSLDLLGSWEYMVRDNEGLELTRTMRHRLNNGQPASQLKPQSSPLPYRFNWPLVHLVETLEVEFAEPQDIVQHCNNCVELVWIIQSRSQTAMFLARS